MDIALICVLQDAKGVAGMVVKTIVQKHVLEHVPTLAIKTAKAIVDVHAKDAKGHVKKVAKTHVKILVKALA